MTLFPGSGRKMTLSPWDIICFILRWMIKNIQDMRAALESDATEHGNLSVDKENLSGELAVVLSKKKGIDLVLAEGPKATKDLKMYKDCGKNEAGRNCISGHTQSETQPRTTTKTTTTTSSTTTTINT